MLGLSASGASESQRPPSIAACFLIRFDKKVGYTIGWKRSIPRLEVEGAVEYSSLPSGLHNVKEDLIYFTHEGFAGLSAFVQSPSTETDRNAQFVAVGILLPRGQGRFGRGWLHSEHLKELAAGLLEDINDIKPLEDYWESNRIEEKDGEANTALSDSVILASPDHELSSNHPILSFSLFLDDFGPLVFPLYRKALLRQRLILLKEPPMRICCEYVYILSVISSLPPAVSESLSDRSLERVSPLFNICIHDIPMLEKTAADAASSESLEVSELLEGHEEPDPLKCGWIACSSDEILSTKPTLFDIMVKIPLRHEADAGAKQWPSILNGNHTVLKATQRDMRRYVALRQWLCRLKGQSDDLRQSWVSDPRDGISELSRSEPQGFAANDSSDSSIVEQRSWAAAAYDSYMWWASAGEWSTDLQEEFDQDAELLFNGADDWDDSEAYARRHDMLGEPQTDIKASGAFEMAMVAYFHRMTTSIFEVLIRLVEATNSTSMDGIGGEGDILVSTDDLVLMGLDAWSKDDRAWVVEMFKKYFGRDAVVQGSSVECCGVKLY